MPPHAVRYYTLRNLVSINRKISGAVSQSGQQEAPHQLTVMSA
jgi:hypothetical protein